jgi:hypothetical protein
MRNIDGRLSKLEHRLGIARSAARYLLIVMDAGRDLGPAEETHIQTLDAAGLLPAGGFGVVDLSQIPDGLSAEKTERFVRENGAKLCGSRSAQSPGLEVVARKEGGR